MRSNENEEENEEEEKGLSFYFIFSNGKCFSSLSLESVLLFMYFTCLIIS